MGRACAVFCTMGAALIFLGLCLVPGTAFAASSGDTHNTVEKTVPQGEDPPGTDEEQGTAPPAEHKGVITPPPVGDGGIYTKVPNPEAGHEKEVIPPPAVPAGTRTSSRASLVALPEQKASPVRRGTQSPERLVRGANNGCRASRRSQRLWRLT